jgi:hypothetical protein
MAVYPASQEDSDAYATLSYLHALQTSEPDEGQRSHSLFLSYSSVRRPHCRLNVKVRDAIAGLHGDEMNLRHGSVVPLGCEAV